MKRKKNRNRTFLLFAASAVLLLMSTVGSTRAALTYRSENYEMKFDVSSIGVTLLENGTAVSRRDYVDDQWQEESGALLTNLLEEGESLTPGRSYEERLSVQNSGSIDSYVRVTLYRGWTKDGKSMDTELSPKLIVSYGHLRDSSTMDKRGYTKGVLVDIAKGVVDAQEIFRLAREAGDKVAIA